MNAKEWSQVVVTASLLLWGAGAEAIAATYTTNFPLTENPISEGGHWINGGLMDWTGVTSRRTFGTFLYWNTERQRELRRFDRAAYWLVGTRSECASHGSQH